MDEQRTCPVCGEELVRREGERADNFKKRRTCGHACGHQLMWQQRGRPLQAMTCERCGKPFEVPLHQVEKGWRYCSWACRKNVVTLSCDTCGEAFERQAAEVQRQRERGSTGAYCSHACYNTNRKDPKYTYACEQCGASVTIPMSTKLQHESRGSAQRFCSQKCRSAYGHVEKPCEQCGALFTVPRNRQGQPYCSVACRTAARTERIEIPCEVCGTVSVYTPARVERQKHFFCSHKCMGVAVGSWAITTGYRHGVRPDIAHFVRSSWEANIARFLRFMHMEYEYEPAGFTLPSGRYTPDFLVDGMYIEVKGQMREDAKRKIDEFRAEHPDKVLVVIDPPMYRQIEREFRDRIPEWEYPAKRKKKAARSTLPADGCG